jgi:hypothetical protein
MHWHARFTNDTQQCTRQLFYNMSTTGGAAAAAAASTAVQRCGAGKWCSHTPCTADAVQDQGHEGATPAKHVRERPQTENPRMHSPNHISSILPTVAASASTAMQRSGGR